jgi:hypothetical protein
MNMSIDIDHNGNLGRFPVAIDIELPHSCELLGQIRAWVALIHTVAVEQGTTRQTSNLVSSNDLLAA